GWGAAALEVAHQWPDVLPGGDRLGGELGGARGPGRARVDGVDLDPLGPELPGQGEGPDQVQQLGVGVGLDPDVGALGLDVVEGAVVPWCAGPPDPAAPPLS